MPVRTTSTGRMIEYRHGITQLSEGSFRCNGCGREFHRRRYGPNSGHSEAHHGARADNQARATATRHADRCDAPTFEEREERG